MSETPTRAPVYHLPHWYEPGDGLNVWADGERPDKTALVIRYGAFGDHLFASSVLPHLRRQGYHVTYNGNERARDILGQDPHIDRFWLQETGRVSREHLERYWADLGANFDKVVNLTESIEGELLPSEDYEAFHWSQRKRCRDLDVNYLERTHAVADVPFDPRLKFYPTAKERTWALRERKRINGPLIVWVLGGSSVHKTWPYMDNVLAALMLHTRARVYTVGDHLCQMLEVGWENESRVKECAGRQSIRETLALAQVADVVVGPETGVMNAVALEPTVGKVCFLSHSSPENVGKHWHNATLLTPDSLCGCYPCHKLHYGWRTCTRDDHTGVALCQARIKPDRTFQAIMQHLHPQTEAAE